MSHPFQFNNRNETRSPLDRQPQNLYPAGQPPSFKTNVNRAKTKKWVEAKANTYDGGDWGEYDEYDEYGTEQEPLPSQANPAVNTGFRQPGQRLGEPARSFTDPQRQQPPHPGRRNSFESGDEHRAFSASIPHPSTVAPGSATGQPGFASYPQQPYAPQASVQPGNRQASAAESDYSDTPQHRRDFSPSALPPPLTTRLSPGPGSPENSPANTSFPPRRSSVGQPESPISLRDRAPSNPAKPLPFIRPADIYRRVEEERQRERASIDSGRPSLDSLIGRQREDVTSQEQDSQARSAEASQGLQPLETVAERKSEYLPDFRVPTHEPPSDKVPESSQGFSAPATSSQQPSLPPVAGLSAFDSDFFSGNQSSENAPVVTSPDDQGFRAVVDQAFTRNDDSRSVPPTPISKDSDSSMSRSNTNSTSGISPIMSRVPSSATSALKNRNIAGEDSSTPAIAEEPGESSTPVSRPDSTAMLGGAPFQVSRKPSPSHSRNVSSSSLPRAALSTPTSNNSPARSPAIEPQKTLPEPEAAKLDSLSPTLHDNMEGGTSASYTHREADIARAMRTGPGNAVAQLQEAEQESQDSFLQSHQNGQSPLSSAAPPNRSESPSKNRVQELAGKFGEVSHSRRGSTQSSIQSWERSPGNSRPASPTKVDAYRSNSPTKATGYERPSTGREASFRPKLPGQWESYATSAPTPNERDGDSDQEQILGSQAVSSQLGDVDLTPTTSRHPVARTGSSDAQSDSLAALKAAGSAMAEALQASVGLGHSEEDSPRDGSTQSKGHYHGDVHQTRPVHLDRTASSVASSVPPTPPEKDTPESEDLPPPPPLKEKSPEGRSSLDQDRTPTRPTMIPQLSTDPSVDDQESDRLRKEIVASLTPQRSAESSEAGRASLHPINSQTSNRESSLLPSEYDSYWADGNRASPRPSTELGGSLAEQSPVAVKSEGPQSADENKPGLLTRFSWEDNAAGHSAQVGAAPTVNIPKEEETASSPIGQRSLDGLPGQSFEGVPDPYFGPGHVEAGTEPDPVKSADLTTRAPTPPPGSAKPAIEPAKVQTIRDSSPPPPTGLHVVNSELHPEAVDMPPRLSREVSPASPISAQVPQSPISAIIEDKKTFLESSQEIEVAATDGPASASGPSSSHDAVAKSPTSDKPLGFREIVTLPSSSERIATYNRTRDYWANADHGLNDWISSAVAANPELSSATIAAPRPNLGHSATSRHKATPSLSLFGKHKDNNQAQNKPYYEQYNSAASQVPTTPTSSSATAAPGTNTKAGGRSASHQMQTKGKDLLHTANVLGGKGMTGAKGLFAKGKSRFKGGDKGSRQNSISSSREASEEPELALASTAAQGLGRAQTMDFEGLRGDNPLDVKKKRRFSSPFHRRSASRSRSRPSSIALPHTFDFGFGTPRSTPPRETPPTHGDEGGPTSFHAPDSWNVVPGDAQHPYGIQSTPPRGNLSPPDRLGVLPSPAKSQFSLLPQENDVPPVPRLPDDVAEGSQILLQSVIDNQYGHSAPPFQEDSIEQRPQFPDTGSVKLLPQDHGTDEPDAAAGAERAPANLWRRSGPGSVHAGTAPPPRNGPTDGGSLEETQTAPTKACPAGPLLQSEKTANDACGGTPSWGPRTERELAGGVAAATRTRAAANNKNQLDDHEPDRDDDDDLPPQVNHDPVPSRLASHRSAAGISDISPPSALDSSERGDGEVSPVMSAVTATATDRAPTDDEDNRPPRLELDFLLQGSQFAQGQGRVDVAGGPGRPGDGPHSPPSAQQQARAYETLRIGADVSPISALAQHSASSTPTKSTEPRSVPTASHHEHDLDLDIDVDVDSDLDLETPRASDASARAPLPPAPPQAPPAAPPAIASRLATRQNQQHQQQEQQQQQQQQQQQHPERLSVTPYQVVHAVQYVPSRSQSSFESWEIDSVVAPSQSDGSQLGDRRDSDVPPLPRLPNGLQQHNPIDASPAPEKEPLAVPPPAVSTTVTSRAATPPQDRHAPPMDTNAPPAGHKRSQSLLSAISSAVSAERLPVSPASSQAPRSRPPSSHRHLQGSPSKTPVVAAPASKELKTVAADADDDDDDGYDLYADHNGIVKDVHDEMGQPLRVASAQAPNGVQPGQPAVPVPTQKQHAMPLPEDEARRYSDERPMSFVWGPRDANGRPQDQINRPTPTPSETNIPAVPPIPNHLQEQYQDSPVDPTYIPVPQQMKQQQFEAHQPQPRSHLQPQHSVDTAGGQQNVSPLQSAAQLRQSGSPPQSNVSSPLPSNASPPTQTSPLPDLGQRPFLEGSAQPNSQNHDPRVQHPRALQEPKPQDHRLPDPRSLDLRLQTPQSQDPLLQNPRLQDPRLTDSRLQDPGLQDQRLQDARLHDPRLIADSTTQGAAAQQAYPRDPRLQPPSQRQVLPQDPRLQSLPAVSFQGPRNQYELQQQMMQRQNVDPRLRGSEYRVPGVGTPQVLHANSLPALQPDKPEPKPSSRPKFGAVFKSLGGKAGPATQQSTRPPSDRMKLSLAAPEEPNRSATHQPSLGDYPVDQSTGKRKEKKTSVFGSLSNRPQSVGTESHISQDSTRVQAADSRLDLRYPAGPAPFKGIPPHQPPPGAPVSHAQPQPHRASTSAVLEPGKKKRFSAISSLFGRSSSTDAVVSAKPPKLSKEEKKAQKAQKHSTAPAIQPPPAQQWPQNPHFRQQSPFGLPQAHTARPFPGMQIGGSQTLSPQALPPGHQGIPLNGMPQQYVQPPGFAQQHTLQLQERQRQNGSAYMDTRQIAFERQQQTSLQISPHPDIHQRPEVPHPSILHDGVAQRTQDQTYGPPPSGYYTPDSKRPLPEQDVRSPNTVEQSQSASTRRPQSDARRVSSQNSVQQQVGQSISQRTVSAPVGEPEYETPQIPAAYNPVSGAYVSPGAENPGYSHAPTLPQAHPFQHPVHGHGQHPMPLTHAQNPQDSRQQYGGPHSRQYPEPPQIQPISPQVSEQSLPPGQRTHSGSSVASVVSPITNPSPGIATSSPAPNQRTPKPRMSSISEATQHDERPWNVNLPEGATEQEIVRARHQQYMVQQIAAQQQLNAERHAKSPSPNPSRHTQSPSPQPVAQQPALPAQPNTVQGFREVLPRGSPQPYPVSQVPQSTSVPTRVESREGSSPRSPSSQTEQLFQPAPSHPEQIAHSPAAFPLPTSPDSANPSAKSPINPIAASLPPPPPPPKIPHSPTRPVFSVEQADTTEIKTSSGQGMQQDQPGPHVEVYQPLFKETGQDYSTPQEEQSYERPPRDLPPQESQYTAPREEQSYERPPQGPPPPDQHSHYEQQPPDEPPPSYDGPGVANEGMDKSPQAASSPQGRHRPPNIMTDTDLRGREREFRQRQASIGLLQHPQPASMAASPQRTSADMGADILRRQLYHQEERDRVERMQRAEIQRMTSEQERQERERARARARELERSVSGGGRVTSLRSVGGSGNGRQPGWERRGSASRPVYELPAEEDDEPVMRATSFPGQEWVPTWTED